MGTWSVADVSASFGAGTIIVTQGCAKFEFAGDWSTDGQQQIQVQGTYTACAAESTPVVATLVVQLDPAQPGAATQTLSVLVTDLSGQVLLNQTLLIRSQPATATPAGVENAKSRSE